MIRRNEAIVMSEMRRTLRCSKCGKEISLYISAEMEINELLVFGKCPSCGNSLQLNYAVGSPQQAQGQTALTDNPLPPPPETSQSNIDDSMMKQDLPTEAIRDLIES
jgi:ribosomal protein S27E